MKNPSHLIAALVLTSAAGLMPFALAPSHAATPSLAATPVQSVANTAEFMKVLRRSMQIGANNEIAKLIRRNQEVATWAVIELCDAYSGQPSERVENEINAIRVGWNTSVKSEFVERLYEYYSLMDSTTRAERAKIVRKYVVLERQLQAANAAKDVEAALALAAPLKDAAAGLAAVGDHYYAARAFQGYASTQDEAVRGDDANFEEAVEAYVQFLKHRDEVDLHDSHYNDIKIRLQVLNRRGFGAGANSGPGAGPGPKGSGGKSFATPAGAAISAAMTFRSEPKIDRVNRPMWSGGTAYTSWASFYFSDKVKTAKLSTIEGLSFERAGPTAFAVITESGRTEFVMTGKYVPVEIQLEGPNGPYPWSFLAITGTNSDPYQGVSINMEPSAQSLTVYVAPAAVISGEVAGVSVEVLDDNMSGSWGDAPLSWSHTGLSPGAFQLDIDSVLIGGGKKALPWSRFQQIEGAWYEMKVEGIQLTAQPVSLQSGKMKLKFKGPKPKYMVMEGLDHLEGCFFDLTASKSIEVPVGRYKLFTGGLFKGKRSAVKKMLILPGEKTETVAVELDKETLVTMGGPFAFDFEFEDLGDTVKVIGSSVIVTGVAGEHYERPWNNRPFPMVSVRKVGQKRGTKVKKMRSQLDQDTLYSDWSLGFHPQDLELPKPKGGTDVEVQLTEKKNGLFGGLSSPWKSEG